MKHYVHSMVIAQTCVCAIATVWTDVRIVGTVQTYVRRLVTVLKDFAGI